MIRTLSVTRATRRLRDAVHPRLRPRTLDGELEPYLDRLTRDAPRVTTAGRIRAFAILNPSCAVTERRLLALIDCVACVIDHDDYGGVFGARLALLAVVDPATAEAALEALTGGETW